MNIIVGVNYDNIFRRAKDFLDVYTLTQCVRVLTSEIYDMFRIRNRELGAFTEFFSRRADVEHAYKRLSGIDGKPSFDEVYSYMEIFIEPFAKKSFVPQVWAFDKTEWVSVSERQIE